MKKIFFLLIIFCRCAGKEEANQKALLECDLKVHKISSTSNVSINLPSSWLILDTIKIGINKHLISNVKFASNDSSGQGFILVLDFKNDVAVDSDTTFLKARLQSQIVSMSNTKVLLIYSTVKKISGWNTVATESTTESSRQTIIVQILSVLGNKEINAFFQITSGQLSEAKRVADCIIRSFKIENKNSFHHD